MGGHDLVVVEVIEVHRRRLADTDLLQELDLR
jgi:hypothetical protein